jgi:ankyrin repeat protein
MGTCLELLSLLLLEGADMNQVNCEGTSPLMVASEGGSTRVVELLLNSKASVNLTDKRGFTAAHYASINGHCDALATLLARGADINREGALGGSTPLMMAFEGERDLVVRMLLINGARVGSGCGTFGFTEKEWILHRRGSSFFGRLLKWTEKNRSPISDRCTIDNCDFYGNPGAGGLCSEHATVGSYTREEK